MSVLPMKRALIVGLRKNRKQMLEYLQRLGVMEIEIEAPADEGEADPVFRRLDVSGLKATLEKNAQAPPGQGYECQREDHTCGRDRYLSHRPADL